MSKTKFSRWIENNKVVIVIIPLIIGLHWSWYELQKVPYMVPQTENKEFTLIKVYKTYKTKIKEKVESFISEE